MMSRALPLFVLFLALTACEPGHELVGEAAGESALTLPDGKLGVAPLPAKGDSIYGATGLSTSVDALDTSVWEVENAWDDTNTTAARAAGIAWGTNSGLTWDEKYRRWIDQMGKIDGYETYYETYELTTPWGKTLPAPALECAETAIFLRATFAAWYRLPFFMVAQSGSTKIYFGHFGARTGSGRYLNISFRTRYADYREDMAGQSNASIVANWPSDAALHARRLGTSGDDLNAFLGDELGAGAYFDEIFLNKRVGYFIIYLLSYYGSMHLASAQNTFNIEPGATSVGDVLLERWQSSGIGHTLIVKEATALTGGLLEAQLISGSMPRRQGKWEDGAASRSSFTNPYTGSDEMSSEGVTYAALGGGIKRWRTPRVRSSHWVLDIPSSATSVWIDSTDYATLGDRPDQFENLLSTLSREEHRDALLDKIQDRRNHLRNYPASCSARITREETFEELYELMETEFGHDRRYVDENYRELEDYVFAELVYEDSKTCCWNSSTADMYDAIMEYARSVTVSGDDCVAPPVFMNRNGGYDAFQDYAEDNGTNWVPWSADESCPQASVWNDTEAEHGWTDPCLYMEILLGEEEPGPDCSGEPLPVEPVDAGAPLALLALLGGLWVALRRR